jgi:uncharacterized membrane protein YgcG
MLAEKFKNQSRRLPGKYTVKTGDSWTKIAEKLYGPLYQDNIKAQKMAEQLARANAKVGTLRPGTVLRVARPRRNPYLTQAFLGDTGQPAPAPTPAAPAYTGAAPQAPVVQGVAPGVNYNVASTQGRPWATPAPANVAPTQQFPTYSYQNNQNRPWAGDNQLPWNPTSGSLLFDSNGNPRPQYNKSSIKGPAITKDEPVYERTYLPGKAPTQPVQGLGYRDYNQPVTVTRNRPPTPEPVSPYRQQLIDRGNAMDPNQVLPFTSVVDQELAAGIRPIFIYDWDRQRLGLTDDVLSAMGYIQNPLTGSWIRQGAASMPTTDANSGGWQSGGGYSGGYSPGFRGGGGGTRGGGYGGGGYTGYGGSGVERARGYPTEAARMIREAGIGLISWRI